MTNIYTCAILVDMEEIKNNKEDLKMKNETKIEFDVMIINSEKEWEVFKNVNTQDEAKKILFGLEEKSKVIMRETIVSEMELITNY